MIERVLFFVTTGFAFYVVFAVLVVAAILHFARRSSMAEAIRFAWCAMAHKPWHVVQKEADTLTRFYCTRCGHVHLKLKRQEDRGKPTKLPE